MPGRDAYLDGLLGVMQRLKSLRAIPNSLPR